MSDDGPSEALRESIAELIAVARATPAHTVSYLERWRGTEPPEPEHSGDPDR